MSSSSTSARSDELDKLMELETEYYDSGYQMGLEDGTTWGHNEGKLFGISKGFEKALEMGKLRGRAMVWNDRLAKSSLNEADAITPNGSDKQDLTELAEHVPKILDGDRLQKHVDGLLQLANSKDLDISNSDEAVADFDARMIKARNKAKIISSIMGEPLNILSPETANAGIEDARGLSARH